jgi:hypothetical protein
VLRDDNSALRDADVAGFLLFHGFTCGPSSDSHQMRVTEGGGLVGLNGPVPGAARLHLADGVALLRPEEQVFMAMLTGFANQQLARNLARTTVEGRENTVRAFAAYVNAGRENGRRHYLYSHLGGLALPGHDHRLPHESRDRLGHGR